MAGLSNLFAWHQKYLVKPAPTTLLTIRVRYEENRSDEKYAIAHAKKPAYARNIISAFIGIPQGAG